MKTNNVSVSIDIRDGDKVYKADWTFTELALKEYKDAGLSRQRQITSLMMKMLQSELAIHLINDEEALAENDIISTYLDPTYSFETYTLDPEQQLTYQKILVDNMGFRAGWRAPKPWTDDFFVFIDAYLDLGNGRVKNLCQEKTFKTSREVDKFYDQTIKELLQLIDVN